MAVRERLVLIDQPARKFWIERECKITDQKSEYKTGFRSLKEAQDVMFADAVKASALKERYIYRIFHEDNTDRLDVLHT